MHKYKHKYNVSAKKRVTVIFRFHIRSLSSLLGRLIYAKLRVMLIRVNVSENSGIYYIAVSRKNEGQVLLVE